MPCENATLWRPLCSLHDIQAIAEELNLGIDALVFLDDNPAERGLVRKLLPQVAVPELPEDPAYDVRTLMAAGYFEAVIFADEDLKRAAYYQDNAKRVSLQKNAAPDTWNIDTWFMSCRVLGRRVENMVLRQILEHARTAGIGKITGTYIPSEKNKLVIDHYSKLGFAKTDEEPSGLTRWEFQVDGTEPESSPMKVVSQGFRLEKASSLA